MIHAKCISLHRIGFPVLLFVPLTIQLFEPIISWDSKIFFSESSFSTSSKNFNTAFLKEGFDLYSKPLNLGIEP